MTDEHKVSLTERLKHRDRGVLLIVAIVGVALVLLALIMLAMR